MIRTILLSSLLVLGSCGAPPASDTKVIVGGTLVYPSQAPMPYGVVVIKNDRIVAIGAQQMIPIPPGSVKTEAYGKYVTHAGGRLESGAKADLMILSGDPSTSPRVERRMIAGKWQE